ncbi:MAG: hypothetical protein OEU32_09595 [Acidimicrobiia bacterium]|nr:hypothetical protein [Acidimicrobiia bacterium]
MAVVSLLGLGPVGAQDDADTSVTVEDGDATLPVVRSAAAPGVDARHAARIDAGVFFSCAVLDTGAVRCWGNGLDGRLGYAAVENIGDDETPDAIAPVDLGAGRTATAVSTGNNHTCALLDDGTVRCWGAGESGQLGYGNTENIGDDETPGSAGPVDLGAGRTAVAITTGQSHSCAVLDDGTVRCWGFAGDAASPFGQLGYGNFENIGDDETPGSVGPVDLGAGRTAVAIDGGYIHTCAVLDDGTVRCWGEGAGGKLGYGNTDTIGDDETPGSVGPVDLGAGRTAVAIAAGGGHSCAVLDDGSVRCWGNASSGKLGYGNTTNIGDNETPGSVGPVDLGAGRTAVAITVGDDHTCALLDDASVRCWGESTGGRLGHGNQDDIGDNELPSSVGPVDLGSGRTATAVNGGSGHTCAALDDATVRCWGTNSFGELGYPNTPNIGDNETPGSVGPVAVGGQLSLVSLASLSQIHVSNRIVSGPADYVFLLGLPNQQVIVGDWEGDAADGFGTRTGNTYTLTDQFGTAHTVVGYGKAGDLTLVGDWNGNGSDTLAVRRGNVYFVKNTIASGPADVVLGYGRAGDDVYVGDWNGNGQDTFAVRRGNIFFVRNSTTTGIADVVFGYGKAGDEVLVGDWDQDGVDTFAVRRGNTIFIRNDFQTGVAQSVISYGRAADQLLVGDFDGDGVDTFAVRRPPAGP